MKNPGNGRRMKEVKEREREKMRMGMRMVKNGGYGLGSNSLGGRREALLGLTQHRRLKVKHRQTGT